MVAARIARALVLVWSAIPPAQAGWFGPSDRDECLADAAKNSKTENGVRLAILLCRKNFPPTKKDCEQDAEREPPQRQYPWITRTYTPPSLPIPYCHSTYPAMFKRGLGYFDDILKSQ